MEVADPGGENVETQIVFVVIYSKLNQSRTQPWTSKAQSHIRNTLFFRIETMAILSVRSKDENQ